MIPLVILLLSVVFFRVAPWLADSETLKAISGFSPLCAFALCGGAFVPQKSRAFLLPAAAVVIPHLIINALNGYPVLDWNVAAVLLVVSVAVVVGVKVGAHASLPKFLSASLAGTVLFHLVTNTVSFFTEPAYGGTLAGWVQCQTTGLPAYAATPTWSFTAKQLAGDLLFTAAFVLAFRPSAARRRTDRPTAAVSA